MQARLALALLALAAAASAKDCEIPHYRAYKATPTNPIIYEVAPSAQQEIKRFNVEGLQEGESPLIFKPNHDLTKGNTFATMGYKAVSLTVDKSTPDVGLIEMLHILKNDRLADTADAWGYTFPARDLSVKRVVIVFEPLDGTDYSKVLSSSHVVDVWDVEKYASAGDIHQEDKAVWMLTTPGTTAHGDADDCVPVPEDNFGKLGSANPSVVYTAADNPCSNCRPDQYCGEVTAEAKKHAPEGQYVPDKVCMDLGFKPGSCSMEYIECDRFANCTESADGFSYKCACPEEASGDGFTAGTGCTLMYKLCIDDFDCPEYGVCNKDWKCECAEGFEGDPRTECTDIVDCPSPVCDDNAICKDHPGNFSCTCDMENGFYGDGFKCDYKCHGDQDCHWNAYCNEDSVCQCKKGWMGNGKECYDKPECSIGKNTCHKYADCIEQEGSFQCVCRNGYGGDGFKCYRLPTDCHSILRTYGRITYGKHYWIDPDFTGPSNKFLVSCEKRNDLMITRLKPSPATFPRKPTDNKVEITYGPTVGETEMNAFVNRFKFCSQGAEMNCLEGFKMFPGMTWTDGFGKTHKNWGSPNDGECQCGATGRCDDGCHCNGKGYANDYMKVMDKNRLPIRSVEFSQTVAEQERVHVKKVGMLYCAGRQFGVPKNCHDAKKNYRITWDANIYIDPDGTDGVDPFMVFCDMKSHGHLGITVINPRDTELADGDVKYNVSPEQIKALMESQAYCQQSMEYNGKDSPLLGANGAFVNGPNGKLDYFPGAKGSPGNCPCGATKSCKGSQACNSNIKDGQWKKDFGLGINKDELPYTRVTAAQGASQGSRFTVGGLQCAPMQFGIEPNCEKYRSTQNIYEDYTYLIDPDGPGALAPFLADCVFEASPVEGTFLGGKTLIHHDDETPKKNPSELSFAYLMASNPQIEALKDRSTYCAQTITVGCSRYSLKYEAADGWKAAKWLTTDGQKLDLSKSMDSCALDGTKCKCNAKWADQTDAIHLVELSQIPARKISFAEVMNQAATSSLEINVGPLVCSEVFPNCAELKKAFDATKDPGEKDLPKEGVFTIDPDGPGGVKPFSVTCRFPATLVNIAPDTKPKGAVNTNDKKNPDPEKKWNDECFPIEYKDVVGNPITPEQITALVRSSDSCMQRLEVKCKNAPISNTEGRVNFTSCDGTTHTGITSFGDDTCTCGVTGTCKGGPEKKCNCDSPSFRYHWKDGGPIVSTDKLPVCEVCLATAAYPPTTPSKQRKRRNMNFQLGNLECNGKPGTGGNTCQDYRKKFARVNADSANQVVILDREDPLPVGCRLTPNPQIGTMVVKPEDPVKDPDCKDKNNCPVNVTVEYKTININSTIKHMKMNEYCTQDVAIFGASDQLVAMNDRNYWYDFGGNKFDAWEELESDHDDIAATCKANKDLCKEFGNPRVFRIRDMENLPVKGVVLQGVNAATLVIGEAKCNDLLRSCQQVSETKKGDRKRFSGSLGGYKWVIDPDGPGDVKPFVVMCHLDYQNKNGISEVMPAADFNLNKPKTVTGSTEPKGKEIVVKYRTATREQLDALTKISDFCWQTTVYDCEGAPINKGNQKTTQLETYGNGAIPAWGTANVTSFDGCACAQTGSCKYEDVKCNCDSGAKTYDSGSITDTNALPISKVSIGGMTATGEATVRVNALRCSKRPVDPPKTCASARKWGYKGNYAINYKRNGEFLISPSPYDPEVKPFMVHCDMETIDKGITVINTKPSEDSPAEPTRDSEGNVPGGQKNKRKVPAGGSNTAIKYYAPTDKQIKAVIDASWYCVQLVRVECQNSPIFAHGNHWVSMWDDVRTPRKFLHGKGEEGFCACGKDGIGQCGGLDSDEAQFARKCNCDVNDDVKRVDIGIISNKKMLPFGNWVSSPETTGSLNITVGPIMCADVPLASNECALGFHDCDANAECIDTPQAFRCFCKKGWQGKGLIANNPTSPSPRANGRECIDDNECSWNPCPDTAICTNLPGTFKCTCKPGFRQTGPTTCVDIDECAEGSHSCAENADCKNLQGSHECRCKLSHRGDGYEKCVPVGQCFVFGDPHVISFDQKWLHQQGDCEYVLAQDGCADGEEMTYKITAEHWKGKNVRPGYYTWVKAVHLHLYKLGYTVTLHQDHRITVNGVEMNQYHKSHIIAINRIMEHMRVVLITGFELSWDGMDVLEVNVPVGEIGKTCGVCGNFNNKTADDWTMGPACPAAEGQLTDNYDLLGRSWTVLDSPRQCKVDCDPETKPSIDIDPNRCTFPIKMVEQECDKLLSKAQDGAFGECMRLKNQDEINQFRFSCIMDGCYEEFNLGSRICHFARAVNQHCVNFDNVESPNWLEKLECKKPECPNNMEYNACGPAEHNVQTCAKLMDEKDELTMLTTSEKCHDGCYCPEGMVQEGDRCVKSEDCGCWYNSQYLKKNDKIMLTNCTGYILCQGNNVTVQVDATCGDNQICGQLDDGTVGCICVEGFLWNDRTKRCETSPCYGIVCEVKGAECKNGTCECEKGYMADCGVCEDIDECKTGQHECDWRGGQECINMPGSYQCKCHQGLKPNGDVCIDINECKYDLVQCGEHSECNNLYGGATCECCAGYKMNANDECVRDESVDMPANSKCCSCSGSRCAREGKVCGTDGKTYSSYRQLTTQTCSEGEDHVDIAYPGECQATCETVVCDKKHSSCEIDEHNRPQCKCPTCKNVTTMFESDMVCATNRVTYVSICHMQKDACEANIETHIEAETIGKPCPQNNVPGVPAGPWTEWGECSEPCKQGLQTRTRDAKGLGLHEEEHKACYNTCPEGPCRPDTCPKPGAVCTVDANNGTACGCPDCEEPKSPVCGRVGYYISTFDSECALWKAACEQGEKDFEMLEKNRCEDKPKGCGRVRNFKTYEDEAGCRADRMIDMGYCYGGCVEGNKENDMCCYGTKVEHKFAILYCPDGSRKNKFIKQIKECTCIKNSEVPDPSLIVV